MIESGQLQVLMALNISDSLSEAADKLNITQSAVSQNLKALEAKVGFPVVARKGKKVILTPSGVRLAKLGRNYFKKLDDAITDILQDQNKIKGSIRIGTLFGIGKSWIASRLISMSKLYPDISVEIKMDFPEKLLKLFDQYELDIIIVPEKMVPVHSESVVLHDESCTLVFPDSKEYNITKDSTLKDLCDLPLIFFEEKDHLFYHFCRERFGSVPRNIKPKLIVNAFGQILQAVNEGIGVAVVPTHVFRRSHYRHVLKTLGKENDILSSRFHFVHHSDDKGSLRVKTVYEYLQEEVENLNVE
jgi:DNA-binding transcriptional LysR family regulator